MGTNRGELKASYATGAVLGSSTDRGGIIGNNLQFGTTVTQSYFDKTLRPSLHSIALGHRAVQGPDAFDAFAKTTMDLRSTITYTDIYEEWNVDVDDALLRGIDDGRVAGDDASDRPWDFGDASSYPKLKVDFNRDGTATVTEFGSQ